MVAVAAGVSVVGVIGVDSGGAVSAVIGALVGAGVGVGELQPAANSRIEAMIGSNWRRCERFIVVCMVEMIWGGRPVGVLFASGYLLESFPTKSLSSSKERRGL